MAKLESIRDKVEPDGINVWDEVVDVARDPIGTEMDEMPYTDQFEVGRLHSKKQAPIKLYYVL